MKKRVAILGASGTIGTVLASGLKEMYSLALIDTKDGPNTLAIDVCTERERLEVALIDADAIVFLAWNASKENFRNGSEWLPHKVMVHNVLEAARKSGVPRVILASSVHADRYEDWEREGELLSPYRYPRPDSPYGATKIWMEMMGRWYADAYGLEVVCIRFGGVNKEDRIIEEPHYEKVWLSHRDCVALVRACIDTPSIPEGFVVLYGVSNNSGRVHDWSNPLGWIPLDDSSERLE